MEYISTRNTKNIFSFKEVFLKGLAPDGGLFIPRKFPHLTVQELESFRDLSYNELAVKIISMFCDDEFSKEEIQSIIKNSFVEE